MLLRPGWERDYDGRPPVYPVGCAGVITHAERLADGRFDIVLRGMEKFRITGEETGKPYRVAQVAAMPETLPDSMRAEIREERRRLETLLVPQPEGLTDARVPSSMPDEDLVNALAQYLEFDPVEKQALLERDGLLERCRSMIELLEMKVLVARHSWDRDGVH